MKNKLNKNKSKNKYTILIFLSLFFFLSGCSPKVSEVDQNLLEEVKNKNFDYINYLDKNEKDLDKYNIFNKKNDEFNSYILLLRDKNNKNEISKLKQIHKINLIKSDMDDNSKIKAFKNAKRYAEDGKKQFNNLSGFNYDYDLINDSLVILLDIDYSKIDEKQIKKIKESNDNINFLINNNYEELYKSLIDQDYVKINK